MTRTANQANSIPRLLGAMTLVLSTWSFGQIAPFGPVDIVSRDLADQPVPGGANAYLTTKFCSSSADGNRIAFVTDAAIDPNDFNTTYDIYLRDLILDQTYLISKDAAGNALGNMLNPTLSRDGQSMVWEGQLPSATPPQWVVFFCDISNPSQPTLAPITYRYDGTPLLSSVLLKSASEDLAWVFVATADFLTPPTPGDSLLGGTERSYRISTSTIIPDRLIPPCGPIDYDVIVGDVSADGRFVSFVTACQGLTPNDPQIGTSDVFVKDFLTSSISLVTEVPTTGGAVPGFANPPFKMSRDATTFVFRGNYQTYLGPAAPPGLGLIWRNRLTGETRRVNPGHFFDPTLICQQLSSDGSKAMLVGYDLVESRFKTVISDLRGGYWQEVSRGNNGAPLGVAGVSYFDVGFYPNHWTADERFIIGVIQSVPQDHSVQPPYFGETQIARIDLGPGRNLGGFVAGAFGAPEFRLVPGLLSPGVVQIVMERLPPSSQVLLGLSSTLSSTPFLGGTAWIWPPESVTPFTSDSSGLVVFSTAIPPALPLGFQLVGQFASPDSTAPFGAVLSNGLLLRIQ